MKRASLWLVFCLAVNGCAHTSTIRSTEPGAHIYVDGIHLGKAPALFTETTGFGQVYEVAVTAPGRKTFYTSIKQTSVEPSALIGGLVLLPLALAGAATLVIVLAGASPVIGVSVLLGYIPAFSAFQLQESYLFPAGDPGVDEEPEIVVPSEDEELQNMSVSDLESRMKRIVWKEDQESLARYKELKAERDRRRLNSSPESAPKSP